IAHVVRPARNAFGRNHQLFAVPVAGGAERGLSAPLDRSIVALGSTWASWAPDGRSILFAVEDGGRVGVHRVGAETGAAPGAVLGAARVPVLERERAVSGLSIARDGAIAFTASTAVAPAEVFIAAADGTGERQLTDLNRAWRAEVALSRPERFRFERDGAVI